MLRNLFKKKQTDCDLETISDNIEELRELTKAMDFSQLVSRDKFNKVVVVGDQSKIPVVGLFTSKDISVALTEMKDGDSVATHQHEQVEIWITYKGYLEVTIDGKRTDKPGEIIVYIPPKVPHSVKAVGETKIIVMTIPYSPDFPQGPTYGR